MIETVIEIETAAAPVPAYVKVTKSKPSVQDGLNTTKVQLTVSTVMVHMISNLKMVKENVELKKTEYVLLEVVAAETEIVTETLDPVLARNVRVTKSKLSVLDGLNSTVVKSHESTVMVHMTLNSKMVKENVVLKIHKLKVEEAMIVTETETVTETPDPVPKREEKVIVSKQKLLGGLNSILVKLLVLTVMEHMISSLKMVKESVVLLNHKLKVVEVMTKIAIEIVTVTETLDPVLKNAEKDNWMNL